MTADPADLVTPPLPASIELRAAESEADLWRAAAAQNAYGEAEPAGPDVDRLRRTIADGGGVALAVAADTGEGVGSGVYTSPERALAEIAAIGVLPAYRRRGIATAVAHQLTLAALDAGAAPFLQADGEPEQRMYARIGYRTLGELTLSTWQAPDRVAADPRPSAADGG